MDYSNGQKNWGSINRSTAPTYGSMHEQAPMNVPEYRNNDAVDANSDGEFSWMRIYPQHGSTPPVIDGVPYAAYVTDSSAMINDDNVAESSQTAAQRNNDSDCLSHQQAVFHSQPQDTFPIITAQDVPSNFYDLPQSSFKIPTNVNNSTRRNLNTTAFTNEDKAMLALDSSEVAKLAISDKLRHGRARVKARRLARTTEAQTGENIAINLSSNTVLSGTFWTPPSNDGSIPTHDFHIESLVQRLVDAIANTTDIREKFRKNKDGTESLSRWSEGSKHYEIFELVGMAKSLVSKMIAIHVIGWTEPIFDIAKLDLVQETMYLTFQERFDQLEALLKVSKRTCMDLLGGDRFWTVLGNPGAINDRSAMNRKQNEVKGRRLKEAKRREEDEFGSSSRFTSLSPSNGSSGVASFPTHGDSSPQVGSPDHQGNSSQTQGQTFPEAQSFAAQPSSGPTDPTITTAANAAPSDLAFLGPIDWNIVHQRAGLNQELDANMVLNFGQDLAIPTTEQAGPALMPNPAAAVQQYYHDQDSIENLSRIGTDQASTGQGAAHQQLRPGQDSIVNLPRFGNAQVDTSQGATNQEFYHEKESTANIPQLRGGQGSAGRPKKARAVSKKSTKRTRNDEEEHEQEVHKAHNDLRREARDKRRRLFYEQRAQSQEIESAQAQAPILNQPLKYLHSGYIHNSPEFMAGISCGHSQQFDQNHSAYSGPSLAGDVPVPVTHVEEPAAPMNDPYLPEYNPSIPGSSLFMPESSLYMPENSLFMLNQANLTVSGESPRDYRAVTISPTPSENFEE